MLNSKLFKNAFIFSIIIFISFLTFYPSFQAALYGDDWLAFFRYWNHVEGKSPVILTHIKFFLTPYGPQDTIMGILRQIYGLQAESYYFISFTLRTFAALSFYPLVLHLTKRKISALFAVLFFAVTTTGLDTTNWVFNMPTYITICLFNLSLYFSFKNRENNNIQFLITAVILYYFAYITTPIRMHGSLPLLFLLEIFWVIQKRDKTTFKKSLLRFTLFLLVFLTIKFSGSSLGPPNEISERISSGITAISYALSQGRFDLIFYPVVMFGSLFIPDFILPFTSQINTKSKLFFQIILPASLFFSLMITLIGKNISAKRGFYLSTFSAAIIWTVIFSLINQFNLETFSSGHLNFLLLTGGYLIILICRLIIQNLKNENLSNALFLGLSWSFLSFFFAWWWVPQSIFPSVYRYLIVSAMGATILLSSLLALNKKVIVSVVVTLICLTILHIYSTNSYLKEMASSHSQTITDRIWSKIPYIPELETTRDPYIFYFEGDGTNSVILHDVITFGFPPHMAILYGKKEADGGFPVPMSEFKELISAVTDGKTMPAYGYKIKPVELDHIYAFHLQGSDNLVDITNLVREKLKIVMQSETINNAN